MAADPAEEDRREFFRNIGFESTRRRMKLLEQKADVMRREERGKLAHVRDSCPASPSSTPRHPKDMDRKGNPSTSASPRGRAPPFAEDRHEFEEARHELAQRIRKLREEMAEEFSQQEAKTQEELEAMPSSNRINRNLKKSLTKMHKNLCQRRINFAVYEKMVDEWSLPKLRAEVRRRNAGYGPPDAASQRSTLRGSAVLGSLRPAGGDNARSSMGVESPSKVATATVGPAIAGSNNATNTEEVPWQFDCFCGSRFRLHS